MDDFFAFEAMVCPGGFGDVSYTRDRLERLRGEIGDTGLSYFDDVVREIDKFQSHSFRENIRSFGNRVVSYFSPDIISRIADIDEFRRAPSIMRRYIMSEPTIRAKYHRGEAGGYDGEFDDRAQDKIGEEDPTWCSVMSGVLSEENGSFYTRHYVGDDIDILTASEKFDILDTYDTIRDLVSAGRDDPSDTYGGKL